MKLYFEGWYYKHQANGRTLALIPGKADDGAFIHVITDNVSFSVPFDIKEYKKGDILQIGNNKFSNSGISIDIKYNDYSVKGELKYSNMVPIQGDIMGPFRFFKMECSHGIISMKHDIQGEIIFNNEKYNFDNGLGYIETDRGNSFPENYSWVHSNDFKENCSITAAVASIPFLCFKFQGCICIVYHQGKEYRLATYKGVKIIRCENGIMELKQGKYHLTVKVKRQNAHSLPAPNLGVMSRIIKESASCPAEFIFTVKGKIIFSGESNNTSYEYVNTQINL